MNKLGNKPSTEQQAKQQIKQAVEQEASASRFSTKGERIKIKIVPAETYSRVVGYFRPVQNWNKGKQEEFQQRKTIDL